MLFHLTKQIFQNDISTCHVNIGEDQVNPMWKLAYGAQSVELNNTLCYGG